MQRLIVICLFLKVLVLDINGQTTPAPNYTCNNSDMAVSFTLSFSSHSAWQPTSSCQLQQCHINSNDNTSCYSSPRSCFDYRTSSNISYCAPPILCSILEPCNNTTLTCPSSTSVCVVNSCCSPQAVCLPLSFTNFCTSMWVYTSNMTLARYGHTASILSNGKVLVTGGYNFGSLNSTELYDPSTETWTATGNMTLGRYRHTASILSNGKVLVTGGYNFGFLNSTELYDPSTGTWTMASNMNERRVGHGSVVLNDGRVLVTGGYYNDSVSDTTELY